ncbi:metallophosphoesterase [Treponema sp.]|uniref:metallophosphoesterase n=1 Tax=Treponema sp. TaxID=166 RepID=UPI00388E4620
MKILCVSDQIDPLVYSTQAKERFKDIDLVLCAGDLPSDYIDFIVSTLNKQTYFIFGNHNLSEFSYYHKQKKHTGPHPTWQEEHNELDMGGSFGAIYAGFKTLKDKTLKISMQNGKKRPLLIAGVSGSIEYNKGLNQYTNRQMFFKLLSLTPKLLLNKILYGKYLDIFLTHASPRHIHDKEDPCHKGFECFNWFIKHFQPTFLVHGHIHLYDINSPRKTKVGNTTVVNAYSHTILELENE